MLELNFGDTVQFLKQLNQDHVLLACFHRITVIFTNVHWSDNSSIVIGESYLDFSIGSGTTISWGFDTTRYNGLEFNFRHGCTPSDPIRVTVSHLLYNIWDFDLPVLFSIFQALLQLFVLVLFANVQARPVSLVCLDYLKHWIVEPFYQELGTTELVIPYSFCYWTLSSDRKDSELPMRTASEPTY